MSDQRLYPMLVDCQPLLNPPTIGSIPSVGKPSLIRENDMYHISQLFEDELDV